jgi:hypothetical protein
MMNKQIVTTVLKAMAVAMGIAVIVMSILGGLAAQTADLLLGIGLFALAITPLQK